MSTSFSVTFDFYMESFFIAYKSSSIHCIRYGDGKELLLCLHGFGEKAESFSSLIGLLKKKYTVLAIDLPFHGKTVWREGPDVSMKDILAIMQQIPLLHKKRVSLMGYSMGGRVALHLYQHMPGFVQKLVLIAPDGLKVNGWYWLATQSKTGNSLFHYCMKKPGLFLSATGVLNKARLINRGVYNYVHQYLQQASKREELYRIWTALRGIRPSISMIKRLIQIHQTPVILIYGEFDRIISYKTGNAFRKNIEDFTDLHVIKCGHRLLHEKNAAAIASLLL